MPKILQENGFTIKDIVQIILLFVTLCGGVYSYAESQAQIQENRKDIDTGLVKREVMKEDIHKLKTNDELKSQAYASMSDDIKDIKILLKEMLQK